MVEQIEHFFIDYNRREGKEFVPRRWANNRVAIKLVESAAKRK